MSHSHDILRQTVREAALQNSRKYREAMEHIFHLQTIHHRSSKHAVICGSTTARFETMIHPPRLPAATIIRLKPTRHHK
jgi:hypothetical protein